MNENSRRKNILIIAEGFEEKPYIEKILSFPNINNIYKFYPVLNAKGSGNIFPKYQYEFQRGFYDLILIFCDADKGTKEFLEIVGKIGEAFFINKNDAMKVFIFANPVTLQIVLSHFDDVSLSNVGKKSNAKIVEELTGIQNYKASQAQIDEMISLIHYSSLKSFKTRLSAISTDIKNVPSTNFLIFLNRFEGDDTKWIDDINDLKK